MPATCDAPVAHDFGVASPLTLTMLTAAHSDLPCSDPSVSGPAPTAFVELTVPAGGSGLVMARPMDADAQVFLIDRTACGETCKIVTGSAPGGTTRLQLASSGATTHRIEVRTTGKDGSLVVLSSVKHEGTSASGTCPSPTPLAPNDYIEVQSVNAAPETNPGGAPCPPCYYSIFSVDIAPFTTTKIEAQCNTCNPIVGPDPGQCTDWAMWTEQYSPDPYLQTVTVPNNGPSPLRYLVMFRGYPVPSAFGPFRASTITY